MGHLSVDCVNFTKIAELSIAVCEWNHIFDQIVHCAICDSRFKLRLLLQEHQFT